MASKYTIRGVADMQQHDAAIKKSAAEIYKYQKQAAYTNVSIKGLGQSALTSAGDITQLFDAFRTGNSVRINANLNQISRSFGGVENIVGNFIGKLGPWAILITTATAAISSWKTKTDEAREAAEKLRNAKIEKTWEAINAPVNGAADNIAKAKVKIEELLATARDSHVPLNKQREAYEQLNRVIPNFNANNDKTAEGYKRNTQAVSKYIDSLDTLYKYEAAKSFLEKLYKEEIGLEVNQKKFQKWVNNRKMLYDKAKKDAKDAEAQSLQVTYGSIAGPTSIGGASKRSEASDAEGNLRKAETALNGVKSKLKDLNSSISIVKGSLNDLRADAANVKPLDLKDPKTTHSKAASSKKEKTKNKLDITQLSTATDEFTTLNFAAENLQTEISKIGTMKIGLPIDQLKKDSEQLNHIISQLKTYNEMMQERGDAIYTIGSSFSQLGNSIQGLGSTVAQNVGTMISAVGNLAQMIGDIIAFGGAKALADALALPFPANLPALATVMGAIGTVTATVGNLSAMKFANGGIVQGATTIGDYNIARVNSGEMILNNRQQSHLFNLLNDGGNLLSTNEIGGNVHFRISGNDLVGVLHNNGLKNGRVK